MCPLIVGAVGPGDVMGFVRHAPVAASTAPSRAPGKGSLAVIKVYVYDLPASLQISAGLSIGQALAQAIRNSVYATANGDEADYFFIPGSGHYPTQDKLLEVFDHVRQNYPWWNRTRDAGEARHMIMLLSDDGPGSAAFERPIHVDNGLPADVHPTHPNRTVMFLQFNGLRDGARVHCTTCFQIGKDIMIPTGENVCGPLCGYNLDTLRNTSIWGLAGSELQHEMVRPRKHRLFYGGHTALDKDDFTGRGGIHHHYVNRTGYLIVRKGDREPISFAEAMRDADFCYSPMGQNGGDTDRYVAAIMFGCIPVMLNSSHGSLGVPHALPFEEALHWERFSTIINTKDLDSLEEQLQCLEPYVPLMRHAMREVWQRMLYSNAYDRTYLGEDRKRDAMHTLMQILEARMAHGYRPSKATMERMAHRRRRFPCTNRPARLHLPSLPVVAGSRHHEDDASTPASLRRLLQRELRGDRQDAMIR